MDAIGHLRHRSGTAPARILEDASSIVVESDVGGVRPEDIDIVLSSKALGIRAGRRTKRGEPLAGAAPMVQSFELPHGIDLRGVKAELKDSLLRVILPRCA